MTSAEPLSTIKEIAEQYRVSEETVRRWVRHGDIPYTQVGPFRLARIKATDVAKEVKSGQRTQSVSGNGKDKGKSGNTPSTGNATANT